MHFFLFLIRREGQRFSFSISHFPLPSSHPLPFLLTLFFSLKLSLGNVECFSVKGQLFDFWPHFCICSKLRGSLSPTLPHGVQCSNNEEIALTSWGSIGTFSCSLCLLFPEEDVYQPAASCLSPSRKASLQRSSCSYASLSTCHVLISPAVCCYLRETPNALV